MNAITRSSFLSERFDDVFWRDGGALLNLGLRVFVGWQSFKSRMLELSDWGATLSMFHDVYHTPLLPRAVAASLGAFGEITFPTLLFVGFLSRPAALGLFFVNLVAVISCPDLLHLEGPAAINVHRYWGILLLVLLVWGPRRLYMDSWLTRGQSRG
ncbi:DoxX family protein [bacterium]|nr:MAG: DoxX family protein [bacterium]